MEAHKGDVSGPQPHCWVTARESSRGWCTAHSSSTCVEPPGWAGGCQTPPPVTTKVSVVLPTEGVKILISHLRVRDFPMSSIFTTGNIWSPELCGRRGKRGPEQLETHVTSAHRPLARAQVRGAGKQRGAHSTLREHPLPLSCPGSGVHEYFIFAVFSPQFLEEKTQEQEG